MTDLEECVYKIVKNLKRKKSPDGINLSEYHQGGPSIELANVKPEELKKFISELSTSACFNGTKPARESWRQLNRTFRPIINALAIELGKVLPYLPGVDKNNIYRAIGIKLGNKTTVAPRVQFDYFHPELITIGNNCLIGDNARIWTHIYDLDYFMVGPVTIGDNVRVGSQVTIFPGTTIGNNVAIDYGAQVHGNIPDDRIVRQTRENITTKRI